MKLIFTLGFLTAVTASSTAKANKDVIAQGYKDQYCTDPRTMRKHVAYTEWADAYSCTRHRCQPGGRNLAIYTVGCKRVEAPESAIECEEVVEDTNMQFPFCCTRLRCLVVVRGEVWTRVLGQPWEVLPAAPWSHMYKMKKPPPSDTTFTPKLAEQGPVYELTEADTEAKNEKGPRSGRKQAPTDSPDCNEVLPRAASIPGPAPDIVIALSTNSEKDVHHKRPDSSRRQGEKEKASMWQDQNHESDSDAELKRAPKTTESANHLFEKEDEHHEEQELEENTVATEKTPAPESSDEKYFGNFYLPKEAPQKSPSKDSHHQTSWTDIPPNQWNEHEGMDLDPRAHVMELHYTREPSYQKPEIKSRKDGKEKTPNLQALVDAIGSRMKDIENVVQKMSEKVHQKGTVGDQKLNLNEIEYAKRHRVDIKDALKLKQDQDTGKIGDDRFKQHFVAKSHASKYPRSTERTQEPKSFIEDNTNYFSDASNTVGRSKSQPKEPAQSAMTYMAPVESIRRKNPTHMIMAADNSEEQDHKKKKHSHKKKHNKTHGHKKHQHQDKRKHFNKLASVEADKNTMSMEDSSSLFT